MYLTSGADAKHHVTVTDIMMKNCLHVATLTFLLLQQKLPIEDSQEYTTFL